MYDGDGNRIKSTVAGVTTTFIGTWFEWSGSVTTKVRYYSASGQRLAMRVGNGTATSPLTYLLGDHLGSTSLTFKADTYATTTQLYKPWGEIRYQSGTLPTQYTYTGQYSHTGDFGLMYYVARWYDPYLNRFIQPDSIVPSPGNPQDYDRYSYIRNNPLRYTDPSGHFCYDADKNEFSEGDCFDDMQQKLLDFFIAQLESGKYTDKELMKNLINQALSLSSDPVIALRAAAEIVRSGIDVPGNWGFEYTQSKFYFDPYTDATFDDSGFGDLADTQAHNQLPHFIGIAYIGAYQKRAGFEVSDTLTWANELFNGAPAKQDQIDRDLGYIAVDYGEALEVNYSESANLDPKERRWTRDGLIDTSISAIESYNFAEEHPFWNWVSNHTPW